ncbi:MAG: HAD family hydrolase, partial [Oceanospirillaceae bacterium]|nr:HAD family hydrolase [Oceanospirillaceae bacterium]
RTGYSAANTAYIGDDLPDLSAIKACSFGATVPNGYWLVREEADWISQAAGGTGAVRELCDLIMMAQGSLESALEAYR